MKPEEDRSEPDPPQVAAVRPLRLRNGLTAVARVLAGRTALVTGAASGIGRAIAERAVADGALVLGVDRNEIGLKALAESLPEGALVPLVCDLSDIEAVDDLAAEHGQVDVVANVAGYLHFGAVEDTGVAELRRALAGSWWRRRGCWPTARCRPCATGAGDGSSTSPPSTAGSPRAGRAPTSPASTRWRGSAAPSRWRVPATGSPATASPRPTPETELLAQQMVDEGALHGMTGKQYERVLRNQIPGGRFVLAREVADIAATMWGPASASISGASWTIDGGHTAWGNQGLVDAG